MLRTPFAILLLLTALPAYCQKNVDVHVEVRPDVKTGIESTTQYPTIQMAMDHAPDAGAGRVFVHIYPGVYHERVIVTQNRPRMTWIGMGSTPSDVVITNSLNAKTAGGTFFTQTVEINGPEFEASNLTIENTAGNTGQAVAAAVRSDKAIFKHVRFLGHQDTLFADYGRQYYTACYITGGVDFIFGNATAVFDHTELHALAPGYLTAQSRIKPTETTGYVIANSRVTSSIEPSPAGTHTFGLGRPWRPYSRVVFLHTELPATLDPAGWNNWGKTTNESTAFYAEFHSTGPGATPSTRTPWSHQLTATEARPFEPGTFLRGADHWDPEREAVKIP
jgi:pectinesterase